MMQLHTHAGHVASRNGIYMFLYRWWNTTSCACHLSAATMRCELGVGWTERSHAQTSCQVPLIFHYLSLQGAAKAPPPCRRMQKVSLEIQAHERPPVAQQVLPTRSSTMDCLREPLWLQKMPQADDLILIYQEWKEGRRKMREGEDLVSVPAPALIHQPWTTSNTHRHKFPPFTASHYPQC